MHNELLLKEPSLWTLKKWSLLLWLATCPGRASRIMVAGIGSRPNTTLVRGREWMDVNYGNHCNIEILL